MQNEPEAAVGWEACVWNASFQASFVNEALTLILTLTLPLTRTRART